MANQTGRPIAPARKLVAAVAGTISVFVVALGLGMSSLGVVIFGFVLLALAVALGSVNVVRRGARAWVSGTAEVRSISPPPTSAAVYGRAKILAVVVAPGLPTSEVEINESKVPVVKWPAPGDTLPITVDVDDMRRVRINWDEAVPRERGDDPPPPPTADYDDFGAAADDDLDAALLDDVEPPPWVTRDRQWGRGPDEPPPPPPPSASPAQPSLDDSTVVVRDTPAGPVVEGEFVDHDDTPPTLPRRAPKAAESPTADTATVAATAGAAAAGATAAAAST
ncbi:glyoxalase/bleomycin resistance/dioxygenase family protein, partial [Actinoplanes sp. NPDC049596]